MITPDTLLTLDVDKPAAGGRMLARHDGQVVLVWGAIPGERVRARVERVGKGVAYAETLDVVSPSPDRRAATPDWRCGGNVYAHVEYPRQRRLKGEIVQDAFGRIGHMPLATPPEVIASPEAGYRMRARLHVSTGRIGFFREGTHELCDPVQTGQLLAETCAVLRRIESHVAGEGRAITSLEIAENVPATERVCHVEIDGNVNVDALASLSIETGLTGLTAARVDRSGVERLAGVPTVTDVLYVSDDMPPVAVRLRRDVRAFFQGNRYLLERLVRHVLAHVPAGPLVDLYAGVGLFGVSALAAGAPEVTLVEGDQVSGADLQDNAAPFGARARIQRTSVETYLHGARPRRGAAFIVDPPRTGMSREAVAGVITQRPARIVYVSCDAATLARDVRAFVDGGYQLDGLTGFDLFPNTAHVETVAVLRKE